MTNVGGKQAVRPAVQLRTVTFVSCKTRMLLIQKVRASHWLGSRLREDEGKPATKDPLHRELCRKATRGSASCYCNGGIDFILLE